MKSPKDMRIIQIDVTNACFHQCSNCTRFCGHHKKTFFMSFETFQKAVDSLDGFVGTIGIMGGEPTLHPDFPRMARYLASRRPPKKDNKMVFPQMRFMDAIHDLENEYTFPYPCSFGGRRQTVNGPGLWSAIGEGYKKHYEVIQDTIQYQAVNDHSNPMYHQPILVTRKELGIQDKEWEKLRDSCWVQNLWSATVTPKGAFFCEIAGALDMLFDGPGGWKIEPGWWQRTPADFGDQLHWCEMCGLACKTFTRDANEEIDDVSPKIYERLRAMGSSKVQSGRVNILKIQDGEIAEESKASDKSFSGGIHYTEDYNDRFNEKTTNLAYKKIVGLYVCHTEEAARACIEGNPWIRHAYILAPRSVCTAVAQDIPEDFQAELLDKEVVSLGDAVYRALFREDYNTYALVLMGGVRTTDALQDRLERLVLNPGTLLYLPDASQAPEYFAVSDGDASVALLNGTAQSIVDAGWDRILGVKALEDLRALWQQDKVVDFAPSMERRPPSSVIVPGKRYAVYGAGGECHGAVQRVRNAGAEVAVLLDRSVRKQGAVVHGLTVQAPSYLKDHAKDIDGVLISSILRYREIKPVVLGYGFLEEQIVFP